MKQITLRVLLPFIIALSSCDCYVAVKGKVVSNTTGEPISGVVIKMVNKNIETTSNSNGDFLIEDQTGFCYDPYLLLTKEGFKPFQLKIFSTSESLAFEINTGSKFIDYDEPVESRIGTSINLYSQDFIKKGDSIIFYLDIYNPEKEIEEIKQKLKDNS